MSEIRSGSETRSQSGINYKILRVDHPIGPEIQVTGSFYTSTDRYCKNTITLEWTASKESLNPARFLVFFIIYDVQEQGSSLSFKFARQNGTPLPESIRLELR